MWKTTHNHTRHSTTIVEMMTQDDDADNDDPCDTNDVTTAPAPVTMKPQNEQDIPSQLLAATLNSLTVTTAAAATTASSSKPLDDDDAPQVTSQTSTTTATTQSVKDSTDATSSIATKPDPSSIPVTIVRSYTIEPYDMDTNITVQIFQERWVVTCSQTKQNDGKITAWLLCQPSMNNMHSLRRQQQLQWEVSHLLGGGKRDDALLTVYCQRIATVFWERRLASASATGNPPPTMLFGLTLWKMPLQTESSVMGGRHEPELFHTMVDLVVNTMDEAMLIPL